MKKFLKVFIIVLLVIGVIAGTAFFFFRKIEKDDNTTPSIVAMLKSDDKSAFNQQLKTVSDLVNSDSQDNRIELIITVNKKLDDVVFALSTYFIDSNTQINDKALSKSYYDLINKRKMLTRMMNEYQIKKDSDLFDRHIGANDLYLQSCSYLVSYSKFSKRLNDLVPINKSTELKFNMIEVYSNVVGYTFSKGNLTTLENKRCSLLDSSNIVKINSIFKMRNNHIVKIENENQANEKVTILNSLNNNLFNKYYKKCNRELFAKNLSANWSAATTPNQSTSELLATYYLRSIYGV